MVLKTLLMNSSSTSSWNKSLMLFTKMSWGFFHVKGCSQPFWPLVSGRSPFRMDDRARLESAQQRSWLLAVSTTRVRFECTLLQGSTWLRSTQCGC